MYEETVVGVGQFLGSGMVDFGEDQRCEGGGGGGGGVGGGMFGENGCTVGYTRATVDEVRLELCGVKGEPIGRRAKAY